VKNLCCCDCVERCVSGAVHSDAGAWRDTFVLHGASAGTVQQKGRHYLLGSLVPVVQRFVVLLTLLYIRFTSGYKNDE